MSFLCVFTIGYKPQFPHNGLLSCSTLCSISFSLVPWLVVHLQKQPEKAPRERWKRFRWCLKAVSWANDTGRCCSRDTASKNEFALKLTLLFVPYGMGLKLRSPYLASVSMVTVRFLNTHGERKGKGVKFEKGRKKRKIVTNISMTNCWHEANIQGITVS